MDHALHQLHMELIQLVYNKKVCVPSSDTISIEFNFDQTHKREMRNHSMQTEFILLGLTDDPEFQVVIFLFLWFTYMLSTAQIIKSVKVIEPLVMLLTFPKASTIQSRIRPSEQEIAADKSNGISRRCDVSSGLKEEKKDQKSFNIGPWKWKLLKNLRKSSLVNALL
ncbi:hypothetical protein HPG69_018943 [Diceros bicornis minor]|uniref:Uncharacterized protein n=1 Tax=Diceros bicornis minor TaxID=77932 RepID=A0A7J7F9Y5_DICBM|nr:hypothetical protein HPG69_018943 [Diceros bicornis minor]